MARDDWFCTFGGALGTFRRFPDSSRHPRKMVARIYPPSPLSWCVYVCVRVHIFVCWKKRKWRRRIPPKKVKPEHAVVVAMLIIYFFKTFFYLPLFYLLSLISVVRFICICLLFTVVFVRSPFCCFCVGVCLPLISLSFYSQNSS